MAQTKKKRRRKHRGTQGGRIDTRPARGRARSRAEAKSQARSRTNKKKGGVAAVLFVGLLAFMGQNPLTTLAVGVLMLGFYIPMAFLLDRFMYQRYLRKEAQKRAEREAQRTGARQAEG